MPSAPIAIAIPIYKEPYIRETVIQLLQQKCSRPFQIVVAEYNPNFDDTARRSLADLPGTIYLPIDRPGIAYARHLAIMATNARVIINFDGDSYFATKNAIDLMTDPIFNKQAVLCFCDNQFN